MGTRETERPVKSGAGDTRGPDALAWFLSGYLVIAASAVLALIDPRLRHWSIVPVTICGVLMGVDVIGWVRRRYDIFDPQALLALFGFHFFYLAPVLHVMLQYWARDVAPPPDWQEALGAMACVNAVGLCIYRLLLLSRTAPRVPRGPALTVNTRIFVRFGLWLSAVAVCAFGALVMLLDGPAEYLMVVTQDRSQLAGLGWLIVIAESFPLLLFTVVVVRWRERLAAQPAAVYLLLLGLIVMQFAAGGLRGSRSDTVWPVLLGLILVHLLVFTVSRRALLVCGLVAGVFMYLGGLYKAVGTEVIDIARGARDVGQVSTQTGRDVPNLLLGDLGRADVQALVLYRQRQGQAEPGYGITYVGDLSFLVPRAMLPERPRNKTAVGTDMLYGTGAFDNGRRSSRVFGLAGEAILNFGPLGGVVSFLFLGLVVRFARRHYERARRSPHLPRKLLAPGLCVGLLLFLGSDLDNVAWFTLKQVVPAAIVLCAALTRVPLSARTGRIANDGASRDSPAHAGPFRPVATPMRGG
ncbi:hypothetical protein [Micromonospora sp. NPDC049679]|uniref:hypothetical protein n=1 Tax=Micromonospora sp. NPDC049679 TaxID=3155920 RepID=UPI00340C98D1